MKRSVFLISLMLIGSLAAGSAVGPSLRGAFSQAGAGKACPFSVIGMWRMEGTSVQAKTLFYDFAPDGTLMIMSYTDEVLPREYEAIGGARYMFDNPEFPKRVEFITKRGNEVFPPGKTTLVIVEYGDDSFVTENPKTRERIQWSRAQTHRRFLTFAARDASDGPAFVMWTTLDGRGTKIEALGLRVENQNGAAPIFGPIPDKLYRDFEQESHKESDVMLRLELTAAEFERSHKVFETWSEYARTAKLPHTDPYLNGLEFLKSAAENLNQCGEKLKLGRTADAATARTPHQQTLEYVRMMRKKNENSHVNNGMFPDDWRPILLSN